jgi:cyclic pyranopterin phosphate synthase
MVWKQREVPAAMPLIDPQGRIINYLRLSVTDRCNLRCSYCMPPLGITDIGHAGILSYEELYRIAHSAVALGIEKIRITGGEPLVRRGIVDFLRRISAIPGLNQLVLTTNGVLLNDLAADLRSAGVQRLNVSLDSLDADTFSRITRCGSLKRVMDGIEAARSCGLPVKLNMVVMRGVNDHEITDFVRLAADSSSIVRFIEYMPAIREPGWQGLVVPGNEILERIQREFDLFPLEQAHVAGPARNYRVAGSRGTIGVITPVSEHFCSACNRIRVTSTGQAKGCLFADSCIDLKPSLQSGSDLLLTRTLKDIVAVKPACHAMNTAECHHHAFSMSSIGG